MATTVRLPIDLRNPRVSSLAGNTFWTLAGLTAHDLGHWEFVKSVDGKVYGVVSVPHNLSATPNASIYLACTANATTGNAQLQISEARVASGGSFNPSSLTAETAQTITVPATAYQRFDVHFPTSGSLAVTPSADDLLIVEFFRNGSNASDTLAVNLLLVGAYLQIDLA
jgi:hypothetical protein